MRSGRSFGVAVVDDPALGDSEKLLAAVELAGFWEIIAASREDLPEGSRNPVRVVIKPDLGAFTSDASAATSPTMVEALIDAVHDRFDAEVVVGAAADANAVWAENRDVFALAELFGYRFNTLKDRPYDVVDLSVDLDDTVFPAGTSLHRTGLSTIWAKADIRIVFAKNKTDEHSGYALCLDSLIGVLPLADKRLHYRTARHPGEVVSDLLAAAPVQFAIIDAITSSHGSGGQRSPTSIATSTIIASADICLADQIGALKMGLDPFDSEIFATVASRHRLPTRYNIDGPLTVYAGWCNVSAPLRRASRYLAASASLEELVTPWLQRLDENLFPAKNPIDAGINAALAPFFADTDTSPTSRGLLVALKLVLGAIGHALESYRAIFDKDALRRTAVGLGIDPNAYGREEFDALIDELIQLERLAADAPEAAPGLRWRYLGGAVLFSYSRSLPIDFGSFTDHVDVARTIQFMNDYLGGVVVAVEHDATGRPVRQLERNIYLPQPNFLALYHGKPIDVTKLEVVAYEPNRRRLYWKTIGSENASAVCDDGMATFSRTAQGTSVTILGRQLFTLPLFWQVVDLRLVPELRAALVTQSYKTFFDRTVANFEALVEGRDIRLGRGADEPSARLVERAAPLVDQLGALAEPLLRRWVAGSGAPRSAASEVRDADGFLHFGAPSPREAELQPPPAWTREVGRYLQEFADAVRRDVSGLARK